MLETLLMALCTGSARQRPYSQKPNSAPTAQMASPDTKARDRPNRRLETSLASVGQVDIGISAMAALVEARMASGISPRRSDFMFIDLGWYLFFFALLRFRLFCGFFFQCACAAASRATAHGTASSSHK